MAYTDKAISSWGSCLRLHTRRLPRQPFMLGSAGDWRKQLESLGGGSSRLQGFSGSSGWRRGLWGMKVSCLDSSRYSRLRKTMFISLSAMSELKWLQVTESQRHADRGSFGILFWHVSALCHRLYHLMATGWLPYPQTLLSHPRWGN